MLSLSSGLEVTSFVAFGGFIGSNPCALGLVYRKSVTKPNAILQEFPRFFPSLTTGYV
jgi:hypothetical protein